MQLSDVKGLKEKRVAELEKAGICTPMDLLSYFPARYVDTERLTDLTAVRDGDDVAFKAVFPEKPKTSFVRRNMCVTRAKVSAGAAAVACVWYNQRYFASSVETGAEYYFIGKARKKNNAVEIVNPRTVRADRCRGRMLILYKPLKGLPSSVIASAVQSVLERIEIVSFIPENVRRAKNLIPLAEAYRIIHLPQSPERIDEAKRSISIEYLSYTICVYEIIRRSAVRRKERRYVDDAAALVAATERLPFALTEHQKKAVRDILNDMRQPECMNRLLQGDVGSGKTVVAFIAMYYAYLSGYQSAIMNPTELLARQHYDTLIKLFPDISEYAVLLHSGLKKTERDRIAEGIASGEYKFIVGTHAVFSEDIKFKNLALAVTDEQHRFGVNQRGSLENKASSADCLVMSATPIPRTLALTLYGDLKQSVLASAPANKARVKTKAVPERKIADMWKYFVECARRDERTYVVCSRVEEDDEDESLVSCTRLYTEKRALGDFVGLLHGKMSEREKSAVMRDFASGKIRILITTTVIEVGIDVPQAVNMTVYNPERYGLSQLHQLRGRVGRGGTDGYCFLVINGDIGSAAERIKFLENCNDGFALAEYDFDTRGAGDFLGSAQHGKGDMMINAANISEAKEIAGEMLRDAEIYKEIQDTVSRNRYEYYKKITLN